MLNEPSDDPRGASGPSDSPEPSVPIHPREGCDCWLDNYADLDMPAPMYGVRVLVGLNEQGTPSYRFEYDNVETVNGFELSGLLHALANHVEQQWLEHRIDRS